MSLRAHFNARLPPDFSKNGTAVHHGCCLYQLAILCSATLLTNLPSSTRADDFCLLSGNRSAYDARIELIELAQHEIDIAYYAIDSGDVALTLLSRLREAARRGVKVNILVDGLKSRLPSDFENLLIQDGIELRAYHPPMLGHPKWLNRRIHYKLLIVDQRAMIVGSRNLEDSHFGLDEENFVDMDALLTGEICRQATQHFDALWTSDEVFPVGETYSFGLNLRDNLEMKVPRAMAKSVASSFVQKALPTITSLPPRTAKSKVRPSRPLLEKRFEVYERRLAEAAERIACRDDFADSPTANLVDHCLDPCVEHICCSFLIHDRGTDKSARHSQSQVIAIIDSAQRVVWIESPYPVLEHPMKDALQRAVKRGVKVTLLTNSLVSTDRTAPYAAYQNDKREFQRMGVRLVEYVGSGTLHSKAILVDEHSVLIGSYNMDARSDRLNLEFGVWIKDARVCEVIQQELQQRARKSVVAERNQYALPQVIRSDASHFKYSQMRFRQLLVPLIRGSL
jgi:putative cardiolipin synthase